MKISDYPFEHLPFAELFKTYVNNYQKLSDFYEVNPFDPDQIKGKIDQFDFRGDRHKTAEVLAAFNQRFDGKPAVMENINRLKKDNALAIVTGQQLGIYGGPMYTILKAISTIHLARQVEQKYNRPVVPVFWLADEDHDYDEIRSVQLLNHNEVVQYALPPREGPLPPVSELNLSSEISTLRNKVREDLLKTDFHDELWELLDACFSPGNSFLEASGQFMTSLFSKHGLVLAGSNNAEVKGMMRGHLKKSIAKADQIRQALDRQTEAIAKEFHQQVHLYDSNLFYLDSKGGRMKIHRNNDSGWKTASGKTWETPELLQEIESTPEAFSPNVFLRPIIQDALLPTLGYVAGPGETSYYGQMKDIYECFNLKMPVIYPRMSATLVEPAIDRISRKLPFEFHEFSHRIEDLQTRYVDRTEQTDIPGLFSEWKDEVKDVAADRRQQIAEIDATLDKAVGRTTAKYFNELDKLRNKVYRAVKKQDRIQLKRIRRVQANLFAGKEMQERGISSIFYMNKYGVDLWDHILDSLSPQEQFDHHKIIYL